MPQWQSEIVWQAPINRSPIRPTSVFPAIDEMPLLRLLAWSPAVIDENMSFSTIPPATLGSLGPGSPPDYVSRSPPGTYVIPSSNAQFRIHMVCSRSLRPARTVRHIRYTSCRIACFAGVTPDCVKLSE